MKVNSSQMITSNAATPVAYITGLFKGKTPSTMQNKELVTLDQGLNGLITNSIQDEGFEGELGKYLIFRTNELPQKIVVVGLGDENEFNLDAVRRASVSGIRAANEVKAKTVVSSLHAYGNLSLYEAALEITEASQSALYKFDKYQSNRKPNNIETLTIVAYDEKKLREIEAGIKRGDTISKARTLARNIMNEPANYMTPIRLAATARQVAKENDLEIEVLDLDTCTEKYGMGAFKAVAQGSKEPPQFIIIKYIPKDKPRKHIALVGKGVTFDSGGLSLKQNDHMQDMRFDKGGAASVIATMSLMKELQPDVAITAIVPATENMPGGSAMKLGDIVRAMNGKTIEILNADAEGRLILADALSYAVSLGVDEIIDIATLTPEVALALGQSYTGLMSNNKELANKIIAAGNKGGEEIRQLPLHDDYRDDIKSRHADIKNIGRTVMIGTLAGAQAGAVFVENFVVDSKGNPTPWVHLDISGTGWPNIKLEERYGLADPPGVGVRTFANYLMDQT